MNVHQTINLIIKEKDTDEYMQSEMEKQLHEQYSINNNANTGSIVTLFVAMLASVGAYGYVYLHTKMHFLMNLVYSPVKKVCSIWML